PYILPGHVRNRQPEVSVEELPLRSSRSLHCGGLHLPQSRPVDHVHLRHPHAGPLSYWDRRSLVGASLAPPGQGGRTMRFFLSWKRSATRETVVALLFLAPLAASAQQHFNGAKALEYARQFVAIGPRWPTSS